ncbi:FAD-dependent oxidoreductase [Novosphingobium fluoreni]|uniref:FAD/NAD(P)-binding protein n=1 Tax=Novosphingobium fluoreni TaxID=1391222 RepID=UPI003DA073DD
MFKQSAIARDRRGGTPQTERDLLRESGLLSLTIPRVHGGTGANWATMMQTVRIIARADSSLAHVYAFHHLMLATVRLFGSPTVPTVAIIGGGFTGAAVAYHLARLSDDPIRILVFEPRAEIGLGVAYSTQDPVHRINVPAARMTLLPDDEDHFVRWLAAHDALDGDPDATLANGQSYPARNLFGRYVAEQLRPLLASGRIEYVRARIASVEDEGNGWKLETDAAQSLRADILVIATSHPPPAPPVILAEAFDGQPKFVADPWAIDALAPIGRDDQVLIVGTGLTMADVVATLDA